MEPKKIINSIEDKMGFTPDILNMMGELNPEMFEHYKKCEEGSCSRLIPCPHIRCQEHRTDMAIKDWTVHHIEP